MSDPLSLIRSGVQLRSRWVGVGLAAGLGGAAALGLAVGLSLPLVITVLAMASASIMITAAVVSTLRQTRAELREAEGGAGGRGYDAVHADATIAALSRSARGDTVLELRYDSRQIVFLDEFGAPDSAQATGPGLLKVVVTGTVRRRVRRLARPRSRRAAHLTITERGVLTSAGRVVHECLLAAERGPVVRATLTAATVFPGR